MIPLYLNQAGSTGRNTSGESNHTTNSMRAEERQLLAAAIPGALFVALMALVHLLGWITDLPLNHLGIYPRNVWGAIGIITAPLVHGDLLHLLSNAFPLLLLGAFLFHMYRPIALEVVLWLYLTTGYWTWVLARQNYHIGASGVVYGLASFLFFSGLFRRERSSAIMSAVVLVLYGGMVYGVLPLDPHISWESHLLGAIAGLLVAFHFRNHNRQQKPKRISAAEEPDNTGLPWHLTKPEQWLDLHTYRQYQHEQELIRLQQEEQQRQEEENRLRALHGTQHMGPYTGTFSTGAPFRIVFNYVVVPDAKDEAASDEGEKKD